MRPDSNLPPTDPADLAAPIRSGDARAFESLFRAYYARLCAFANYYVRAPDVAEEVVADVFAAIWIHRKDWTPRSGVSVYLFAAVRNRAFTAYQRFAREAAWEDTFAREELTPALGAPELRPDLMLEAAERITALKEAVFRLTVAEQVLLHLRWRELKTFAEIAEIVGSNPEAVKKRTARLVKKIRERLPEYFE